MERHKTRYISLQAPKKPLNHAEIVLRRKRKAQNKIKQRNNQNQTKSSAFLSVLGYKLSPVAICSDI